MQIQNNFKKAINNFLHLFYPHNCIGCGADALQTEHVLCFRCFQKLPFTKFEHIKNNAVEKTFYGRCRIENAASLFYFNKQSIVQSLIFELKYRNNKNAGLFIGRQMGLALKNCERFSDIDLLIPIPLNEKRLKQRGYNQAEILIEGMNEHLHIPRAFNAVKRIRKTETQTHKGRTERWQTMQQIFEVADAAELTGKHILLIDDVITTGATIESLINTIHAAVNCRISVFSAAWTAA